jgi:hypothetical protein
MTAPVRITQTWDTLEYQRIVSVEWRDEQVQVCFGDGAVIQVPPTALVSPETTGVDWARLRTAGYHVVVPAPNGDIEIPWDVLRVHSDPEFAGFWEQLVSDANQANATPGGQNGCSPGG